MSGIDRESDWVFERLDRLLGPRSDRRDGDRPRSEEPEEELEEELPGEEELDEELLDELLLLSEEELGLLPLLSFLGLERAFFLARLSPTSSVKA